MGFFQSISRLAPWKLVQKSGLIRPPLVQVAALCYRKTQSGYDILLITSRGKGDWILPKGWPKKGRTLARTAAEEAFEEAGVIGTPRDTPCGRFRFSKEIKPGFEVRCLAWAYEIPVDQRKKTYPEVGQRKVQWFSQSEAADAVAIPELAALLRAFVPSQEIGSTDENPSL